MGILKKSGKGVQGLLSGMAVTLGHFVRFDEVITQQYPENRAALRMAPRFRGKLELIRAEGGGAYKCTACGLCVRACPNNSLEVEKERDPETKKFRLLRYVYHFERCTLCALCVDACKFDAIRMGQQYENAVYDRAELTQVLNEPVPRGGAAAPAAASGPAAAPVTPSAPAAGTAAAPPAPRPEGSEASA